MGNRISVPNQNLPCGFPFEGSRSKTTSSSKIFSHSKLLWIAEWHIRDETYQAALACLIDAIHAEPFTKIWETETHHRLMASFSRLADTAKLAPITTPNMARNLE